MWHCSPGIAECVRLKIVDALLTLTMISSTQPSYSQKLCATNRIWIFNIQHCVSEYYHLYQGALLPLNFWSTSIHVIWAGNDVALSHSCACGRQFTACRSFHMFLLNIARFRHLSSSSSFSSNSMTYHKRFQLSQPCAPGLCGDLCSCLHGWIQHSGRHSVRFVLRTDRLSYDWYDITHLNLVCIFRH